MGIFQSIKKKISKQSDIIKETVAEKVDLESIAEGADDAVEKADEYNAAFGTGDAASKAEVLDAVFGDGENGSDSKDEDAAGSAEDEKAEAPDEAGAAPAGETEEAQEDLTENGSGDPADDTEEKTGEEAAEEAAGEPEETVPQTPAEVLQQKIEEEKETDSEGPIPASKIKSIFTREKGEKKSRVFLTRPQIILGTVILIIAVVAGFLFTSCGEVVTEKTSHTNRDDIYGKGDYVYDTITFTGSGMKAENTLSIREMELLAAKDDDIGYEANYSVLSSDSELFVRKFTGIRFYEILEHAGLRRGLPDDTKITLISKDGKQLKITLGTVENGRYSCFEDTDSGKASSDDLPVILAYSCDDVPLIGPIGDNNVNREFSADEGYVKSADNVGGPMRFVIGQKNVKDRNEGHCLKSVTKIIVGDKDNKAFENNKEIKKDSLEFRVYDDGKREKTEEYSCEDIKEFAESSKKGSFTSNYYGEDGFYEAADLWAFLDEEVSHFDRTGKIRFTYDDNTQETLDLKYLKSRSKDFSDYVTEKGGLMITCVKPALGYCKDGTPAEYGRIYALLPANGKHKAEYTTKRVTRIQVYKEHKHDTGKNPNNNDRLAINGEGLKETDCFSVYDLRHMKDIAVINGRYSGVSLYDLLKEMGIGVDAGEIQVTNFKDETVTIPVSEAEERSYEIMIGVETALEEPMPDKRGSFLFKNGSDYMNDIKVIKVTAKDGQWDHFAKGYEDYLDYELKVSGSAVEGGSRTYTLEELERIGGQYTNKDSYAADEGKADYQGVLLEWIVEDNLKSDLKRPGSIKVISTSGYEVDLPVNNAYEDIDSRYQMNEERPAILAYSRNGMPLVPGKKSEGYKKNNQYGPLRLVVENQTSKWVPSVKEIVLNK